MFEIAAKSLQLIYIMQEFIETDFNSQYLLHAILFNTCCHVVEIVLNGEVSDIFKWFVSFVGVIGILSDLFLAK
jgi:hypothetical protein